MAKKIISMLVTDEQHNIIRKAAMKDAIQEDKLLSVSAYVVGIVLGYINGNEPKTPSIVESKESIENVAAEQQPNDWGNLDI